jgi:ABC-2 type transport system ATP-binding protein
MATNEAAIEIKNLSVRYRRGVGKPDLVAVDGLDLRITPGEVVGFIGPNGAGKTTTIKALMGFIFPSGGEVRTLGYPAGSIDAKRRIGYLPEVALYYQFMRAREVLRLYGSLMGMSKEELERRVNDVLQLVGLRERENDFLKKYSKGMLQRIGIAQAILGDPDLLILDEVTSGLDPIGRRDLRDILKKFKDSGKTIFFSSHELSEVALLCDRVIIIDAGRVKEEKKLADLILTLNKFYIIFRSEREPKDLPFSYRKTKEALYRIDITDEKRPLEVLKRLIAQNYEVVEFAADSLSLEDYFVNVIGRRIT